MIGLPTTSLTLATPAPATVDFGGTSSLSGVLTGGGSPVAGRTVTVQTRALNATAWVDVPGLSAVTTATGGYTIGGLKPTATADYRVVFAGDPSFQASASSAQRVFVRGVLTLDPLVAQVSRNRQLTYSGTSGSDPHRRKDHHHGLGTRPEDAHLERHRGRERLLDREHEGAREGGNLHRRRDLER